MDSLTIAATSGLRSRMESLDLLANNLANATTAGFKADRESYDLYASEEALRADYPPVWSPTVQKNWTDFRQGALQATGKNLDFAIDGAGFFVVDANGSPLLTRNGGFRVSKEGFLETSEGHKVQKAGGGPIKLDPYADVVMNRDGSLVQNGTAVGKIQVSEPGSSASLSKAGSNYFSISDVNALQNASGAIYQGQLESANFASAESAVRLVNVMRQFEMLQRAMTIGGEMSKKAVEEVARVTS
jgi:flagellar basal-body rod protein FlgF